MNHDRFTPEGVPTELNTNRYGGDIDTRIGFAVEVAAAVVDEIGADRTALRISPGGPSNITDSDTAELYPPLVHAIGPLGLAYLHVRYAGDEEFLWPTTLILNRARTDLHTSPGHRQRHDRPRLRRRPRASQPGSGRAATL